MPYCLCVFPCRLSAYRLSSALCEHFEYCRYPMRKSLINHLYVPFINVIVRARSPYIIFINESGQTSGKLELRIWKKGETKPTLPTYSFTKPIPSATQTLLRFNISPYLKDFISNKLNDVNTWYCKFECRLFSNNVELTAQKIEGIAVNGYTTFLQGQNYSESNANRFSNIKRQIKIGSTNKLHYYDRVLNEISEITATNVEETCEPILEPQLV